MPACATKVAGLSTSLMVSVPEVEMSAAESVSVRLLMSAEQNRGVVGAEDVDGEVCRAGGTVVVCGGVAEHVGDLLACQGLY